MKIVRWIPLLALVGLLLPMACDDTFGPEAGPAQIQILLTDAPADYIETAVVCISRAYLVPGEDEEGDEGNGPPWVDLFNDPANPWCHDLLQLRNGITEALTDPEGVEPGEYGQLRLVVSSALVTLKEPYTFSNGDVERSLFVPSGMQTGIKVLLNGPIEVQENKLVILTVDFDVDENFVFQGNPETPAGIHGILFTPVLKEKGRTQGAPES
jgi:hypothetical protein